MNNKTITDVELIYKRTDLPNEKILQSSDAAAIARKAIPELQIALKEFFGILLLNRSNGVLARTIISSGGLTATVVDTRHILQHALLANAAGIILFHNHPSGQVQPSVQDTTLTKKIKEACLLFDIILLDHVILSGYKNATPNYFSFADEGLI